MIASIHELFKAFSGGQFEPVYTGQFKPVSGGQFKSVWGGQFHRFLHAKILFKPYKIVGAVGKFCSFGFAARWLV